MRVSIAAVIVLTVGFVGGMRAAPRADSQMIPVHVGEEIRVLYAGKSANMCKVAEAVGTFVRCADSRTKLWLNLAIAVGIDHPGASEERPTK